MMMTSERREREGKKWNLKVDGWWTVVCLDWKLYPAGCCSVCQAGT